MRTGEWLKGRKTRLEPPELGWLGWAVPFAPVTKYQVQSHAGLLYTDALSGCLRACSPLLGSCILE